MGGDLIEVEKPKNPKYAVSISWGWIGSCLLLMGFIIFEKGLSAISLSDLGGYMSGVFAPVALYWFYLSFRVQAEELQLQRKELKNSVEAQQGSKKALAEQASTLQEQSDVLKKQLEFTQKQFELYLQQLNRNRPKFQTANSSDWARAYNNQIRMMVKNIGAKADITGTFVDYSAIPILENLNSEILQNSLKKDYENGKFIYIAYGGTNERGLVNLNINFCTSFPFDLYLNYFSQQGNTEAIAILNRNETDKNIKNKLVAFFLVKLLTFRFYYSLTLENGGGFDDYVISDIQTNDFLLQRLSQPLTDFNDRMKKEQAINN